MTPLTRPRGPLPPRVYWTRRLLVLVLALALVYGVARLLGGGVPGADGPSARPVAAGTTSVSPPAPTTPASTAPAASPTETSPTGTSPTGTSSVGARPTALSAPSGRCRNSDVLVAPSVASPAFAARPVVVALTLTTKVAEACSWVVSADSLVVKVTSGDERFWSTQDCRGVVPRQSVVVRRSSPTTISVTWSGQGSDADCSRSTSWSEPGSYDVVAAAFGSEPADVRFWLYKPVRETITAEPSPSASPSTSATATRTPRER